MWCTAGDRRENTTVCWVGSDGQAQLVDPHSLRGGDFNSRIDGMMLSIETELRFAAIHGEQSLPEGRIERAQNFFHRWGNIRLPVQEPANHIPGIGHLFSLRRAQLRPEAFSVSLTLLRSGVSM